MYKRFIVLLGVFMGSQVPAAGQTPVPQIGLAQEHDGRIMATHRIVSPRLPTVRLLLSEDFGKFPAHFSLPFAGAQAPGPSLDHFSPIDKLRH